MIKPKELLELRCNVDDMTGEALSFAMDRLYDAGALDVYTTPVGMKKSRTGILINVTCREEDREVLLTALFKHTTTIGVRECKVLGYALERKIETVSTELGDIRLKTSSGFGVERKKYEYDDLTKIAKENNLSIEDVIKTIK